MGRTEPELGSLGVTWAPFHERQALGVGRIYADAEQLRAVFSEMCDDVTDEDGMEGSSHSRW